MKSLTRSALTPLVVIWLAVHAVLLALILSIKFLTVKTVLAAMLLTGVLAFLISGAKPRKFTHSP